MIGVFGSNFGEEEALAAAEVVRSQWTGMGKKVAEFEQAFMVDRGLPNMLMTNSGSNALFLGIKQLNLPEGSEVILPAVTWVACAQAVVLNGLKPVFCDVALDTQNASAESIQKHINPNSSAIMVVHYAGMAVDMDPIMELGLPVIEDAAHAVDTYYKGKICGSIGDVGIYSFDSIKNLAIGNAGGLTFKDERLFKQAMDIRYCGVAKSGFENTLEGQMKKWWEYRVIDIFFKAVPDDISGAIGLVQLKRLQHNQDRRRSIWLRYDELLADLPNIELPVYEPGSSHSFFTYFIQTDQRNELAEFLLEKDIYTTLRYQPLYDYPVFGSDVKLKNTEILNDRGLNIPLHPRLKDEEVDYVAASIRDFFK